MHAIPRLKRHVVLACSVVCSLAWVSSPHAAPAIPDMSGKILTVLGPIDPADAGITLPHEHIFIDFRLPLDEPDRWVLAERKQPVTEAEKAFWKTPIRLSNLQAVMKGLWENEDVLLVQDMKTSLSEVAAFKAAGGGTIVDVTSIGIGRNPQKLAELSRLSGLNVVMGAGWYRRAWRPAGHDDRAVASLTQEIIRDVTVGVNGTDIRSGIIGEVAAMEIATEPADTSDVKGIRAAARASRVTGAALSLHQWVGDGVALPKTLDIIKHEGGDLSRVIVGHIGAAASQDLPYLEAILARGVTLEFDLLGTPYFLESPKLDDRPMADAVVALTKAGYGGQILLSHDVCTKLQQKTYGGHGFDYVLTRVVPYLKRHGLTDADIQQITVTNPTRLLTFAAPDPAFLDQLAEGMTAD